MGVVRIVVLLLPGVLHAAAAVALGGRGHHGGHQGLVLVSGSPVIASVGVVVAEVLLQPLAVADGVGLLPGRGPVPDERVK